MHDPIMHENIEKVYEATTAGADTGSDTAAGTDVAAWSFAAADASAGMHSLRWKLRMIESASSMAIGRTSASALIFAVLPPLAWVRLNQKNYSHFLDLIICHVQTQLANSCLDSIPASQS